MSNDTVRVSFTTCDCEWWTKYCDDYHTKTAYVPREVLNRYTRVGG